MLVDFSPFAQNELFIDLNFDDSRVFEGIDFEKEGEASSFAMLAKRFGEIMRGRKTDCVCVFRRSHCQRKGDPVPIIGIGLSDAGKSQDFDENFFPQFFAARSDLRQAEVEQGQVSFQQLKSGLFGQGVQFGTQKFMVRADDLVMKLFSGLNQ